MTKYCLNIMNLINQSVALVVHAISTYQVTTNILWYSLIGTVRTYICRIYKIIFKKRSLNFSWDICIMNTNYGTRRSWHLLLFSRDDSQKKVQKINFENTVRYRTSPKITYKIHSRSWFNLLRERYFFLMHLCRTYVRTRRFRVKIKLSE